MEIIYHKKFVKNFIKLREAEKVRVQKAVALLVENKNSPLLKLHRLTSNLKNSYSISAGGDLRVVLREESNFLVIILLAVGSHNQVY